MPPGLIFPGVAGAILALLGLSSLAILPINWVGVTLLLLAAALFVLEAKFTSHGILGIGGTVCMVLGALLLINGPPEMRIHLSTGDVTEDVVVAIITNMSQLSYVGDHPVTLAPEARLDEGLDVLAMRTFPLSYVPRLAWSALSDGSHVHFKQVLYLHDLGGVKATSAGAPFSVHVDGEFLEDRTEVEVELVRNGLAVLV